MLWQPFFSFLQKLKSFHFLNNSDVWEPLNYLNEFSYPKQSEQEKLRGKSRVNIMNKLFSCCNTRKDEHYTKNQPFCEGT